MPGAQRVSEYYNLSGDQGSFDFVDVYINRDVPLFIDPTALRHVGGDWANRAASSIQTFFQAVIDEIRATNRAKALALLKELREDNSTHLGFSSRSKGSGLGDGLAFEFYQQLKSSAAVKSGLVSDLEDTALLVEGVGPDRISDVTTNLIRLQLIEYTQAAADFYGIPLKKNVAVPPFWDDHSSSWKQSVFDLPIAGGSPLLLVPKEIVRRQLHYDSGEYYRHYILEHFKDVELRERSPLVYVAKGQPRIRKGDVEDKYRRKHRAGGPGIEKRVNVDGTTSEPDLLSRFKRDKEASASEPLSHKDLAESTGTRIPDFDELLRAVLKTPTGQTGATEYERAVEALLTAALYPNLAHPVRQEVIHEGRKRLDINYTNVARHGFFDWVGRRYPAANIVVECKNYSRDLGNPEYDQLAGRFSPSRGQVGLLVFRSCTDKSRLLQSCRDTALDHRGYIIALDDEDLKVLVEEAKAGNSSDIGGLLHKRFNALIR